MMELKNKRPDYESFSLKGDEGLIEARRLSRRYRHLVAEAIASSPQDPIPSLPLSRTSAFWLDAFSKQTAV